MRLDEKISASVDVVSEVPQGSVLGALLFILYTSKLFHVLGNYIVGYENDTSMYAIIPIFRSLILIFLDRSRLLK